jgi:hypothetical protein
MFNYFKSLSILFVINLYSYTNAQSSFEGKIEFLYYQKDTSKNEYLVKNEKVRLDQYSKSKKNSTEGSYLFDLNKKDIKILSHTRKLWNTHKSTVSPTNKDDFKITKTEKTKNILGYPCYEYIVTNKSEDTEITYWITNKGNFDFFIPMLQLWNRKDKQSVYFTKITGLPKGSMPLLSIEKQISTGRIITKLETTKITSEKIKSEEFEIPQGYKKFEE